MKKTNARLHEKADAARIKGPAADGDDPEVWTLLAQWQRLNTGRGMLAGIGTLLGAWAVVGGV